MIFIGTASRRIAEKITLNCISYAREPLGYTTNALIFPMVNSKYKEGCGQLLGVKVSWDSKCCLIPMALSSGNQIHSGEDGNRTGEVKVTVRFVAGDALMFFGKADEPTCAREGRG